MSISHAQVDLIVEKYRQRKRIFELFLNSVESSFMSDVDLNTGSPSIIHSTRKRLKDDAHLADKIHRKCGEGKVITPDNVFSEVTDLAGIRVLHLHQAQFVDIHNFISNKVKRKSWRLLERPVAYTWDPESVDFFRILKLKTSVKPSYYTSVHYLLAPANDEDGGVCCEVQVRTLFEEAWGEIDHSINYPYRTEKLANLEQLRVLSKLVSTGSRLADSIFKVHHSD